MSRPIDPFDNAAVAELLERIAALLELRGENPFKVRAYRQGAHVISGLSDSIASRVAEGTLDQLEGIGPALKEKLSTLTTTGSLPFYDELRAEFPEGIFDLLALPGLGPKKVKRLVQELALGGLEDLESACRDGRVTSLDGFGPKSSTALLEAIEQRRRHSGLFRASAILPVAEEWVDMLRTHPDVVRVSLAGSLRRCRELVKDIDIVASSPRPDEVMQGFLMIDPSATVIARGRTKSSLKLADGSQIDLRVVPDRCFASALHHFTGSRQHHTELRRLAREKNLRISEWGIFPADVRSEDEASGQGSLDCRDEAALYDHLGLEWIPPELREGNGEIEAAATGGLPKLIEWSELRGCFHNHTTASDGRHSLRQMVEAAASIGLEYIGIADHSRSQVQANGLDPERLAQQVKKIALINREMKGDIHVFSGIECDILKDGSLDFDDSVLASLDYVVASVHSSFTLTAREQTRRICRAMENPYVTMLGHPTGRLLLERQGYALDMMEVLKQAARTGTWIELNANPCRLDLDWRHWKQARDLGVKCVINPDAHRVEQLGYLRPAVGIARKGWLRRQDVVNCLPLPSILRALARKRGEESRKQA